MSAGSRPRALRPGEVEELGQISEEVFRRKTRRYLDLYWSGYWRRRSICWPRIDTEEFYRMLDGVVIDDAKVFTSSFRSGRTATTSSARTARSEVRRRTSGYARR